MTREDPKMENSPVVISEDDDYDDTKTAPPADNRNIASALTNASARRVEHLLSSARATPDFKRAPLKDRMTQSEAKAAGTKPYFQKDNESTGYRKAVANYEDMREEKRFISEQIARTKKKSFALMKFS